MKLQKDFVAIISADTESMTLKQKRKARLFVESLVSVSALSCKKAIGSWKGEVERSFVVTGFEDYGQLVEFASTVSMLLNQEVVMVQDRAGNIQLVDGFGGIETLKGKLVPVSEAEAKTYEAWTKFKGHYWVVK